MPHDSYNVVLAGEWLDQHCQGKKVCYYDYHQKSLIQCISDITYYRRCFVYIYDEAFLLNNTKTLTTITV